jgi:hypothetical protein
MSLECYACRTAARTVTFGVSGSSSDEARLVFNKYGDTYFLSEVWTPGQSQGGGLSKSKTEREIASSNPTVARVTLPAGTNRAVIARR